MSDYYPTGVNFTDVDGDYDAPEAYLPIMPNPLDTDSPNSVTDAGERLATYLYNAKGDPGTKRLQWHAAQVALYPWGIAQDQFDTILDTLPNDFPAFENDAEANEFYWTVENSLTRADDEDAE